jgi:hypothetical protein
MPITTMIYSSNEWLLPFAIVLSPLQRGSSDGRGLWSIATVVAVSAKVPSVVEFITEVIRAIHLASYVLISC